MMGWLRWKILSESEMSGCWLIYEWPWYWEHGSRWQSWYLYPVTSGNDHVIQWVPKTTKSYPAFTVWEILLVAKPLSLAIFWIHAQSSSKNTCLVLISPAHKPFVFHDTACPPLCTLSRAEHHIHIVRVLSLLFFSYNYLRSALTQETAVESWVGWKWHSLETFLFTPSAPCWCDPNWQGRVVNSASLTAIGTTDQWFGVF